MNIQKRLLLITSIAAGAFFISAPTLAQTNNTETLTALEVSIFNESQSRFRKLVSGLKSELYVGRAQNFSAFNLDLQSYIHFRHSTIPNNPNPDTFNIASNGNLTIHGVPVWPIQGFVRYSVPGDFLLDGSPVQLRPAANVYYMVESDLGVTERLNRWEKLKTKVSYQAYQRATGRVIGVITMDLQNLSIDFYQVQEGTNELIRAGVFTGEATKRRR